MHIHIKAVGVVVLVFTVARKQAKAKAVLPPK